MLTFHVLNVGHGSSIVVDYEHNDTHHFGVIDSNARAGESPKALLKLRELGATRVSFLALTHPHKDHFSGLFEIIRAFPNAIDYFYSCPFGDLLQNRNRLRAFGRGLTEIINRSDGEEERLAAWELSQILRWADTTAAAHALEWHECKGEEFSVAPPGFADVDIHTVLPPSRVIGDYVQKIQRGDMSVLGRFDDNEISLAFLFSYKNKNIVLGGDGTVTNWRTRRKYEEHRKAKLNGHAVNLPHHGSKYDSPPEVLTQLFASEGDRYGITSANGSSHPDIGVIEWLESNSVKPFCTNLIPSCGANAQRLLVLPDVEPQLARWIREVAVTAETQACQGNIKVSIAENGDLSVTPEYAHPCAYRGDFLALFPP
jgi:beta-lactamase superfamily II metal-dependent hydrolase